MAPRPEQKLQPQKQPMMLAGGQAMPKPKGPTASKAGGSGGARIAKGMALAVVPVALLGYAAIASGLVGVPSGKLNLALLFAAAAPSSSSAVKAEQPADEGNDALGRIGIHTQLITQDLIKSMSLHTSRQDGIVVLQVYPNTAAERAGMITGDILLTVDGVPIGDGTALTPKIAYTPIGESVTFILERGGVTQALPVKVERRPCDYDATDQWCATLRK
jgi:S1-C subfamily serine protease